MSTPRRILLASTAALALVAGAARAHAKNDVTMAPDERMGWACRYPGTLAQVVSVTVRLTRTITRDSNPGTLVTGAAVSPDPELITWTFTPGPQSLNNVYSVAILAERTNGNRIACTGTVTVRRP